MLKKLALLFPILILLNSVLIGQENHSIMSYNLLNYPGTNSSERNPYYLTTVSSVNPDILVVQEMISGPGMLGFLNDVLLPINPNYQAALFIDGPDTDNALFFKTNLFTFISNTVIPTALRDINEFKLIYNPTSDTLRIYSVHLKASTGTTNEQQRFEEVTILRNVTDALAPYSNYLVCGDFNIYGSNEPAYQMLLDNTYAGYFIDLFNLPGSWNQSQYAQYHTQSPRTRQFGGGANGGLDDRFDMMLFSQALIDSGGITYVPNTYRAYGNDGLHYNDSINRPPNSAVGQTIADAIHYASDHIPVFASFRFDNIIPVELASFNASVDNDNVFLRWTTATETNNQGFEVQRLVGLNNQWQKIGFVSGNGNSTSPIDYFFQDKDLLTGDYNYRLKQIDFDGSYSFSKEINVSINSPEMFVLYQNYPNPFNPVTTIQFEVPYSSFVTLKVFDVLGNEISSLVSEVVLAGSHKVNFNASNLPSGIYFYSLYSGGIVLNNKMILIK
jgi:hypothetical protein